MEARVGECVGRQRTGIFRGPLTQAPPEKTLVKHSAFDDCRRDARCMTCFPFALKYSDVCSGFILQLSSGVTLLKCHLCDYVIPLFSQVCSTEPTKFSGCWVGPQSVTLWLRDIPYRGAYVDHVGSPDLDPTLGSDPDSFDKSGTGGQQTDAQLLELRSELLKPLEVLCRPYLILVSRLTGAFVHCICI